MRLAAQLARGWLRHQVKLVWPPSKSEAPERSGVQGPATAAWAAGELCAWIALPGQHGSHAGSGDGDGEGSHWAAWCRLWRNNTIFPSLGTGPGCAQAWRREDARKASSWLYGSTRRAHERQQAREAKEGEQERREKSKHAWQSDRVRVRGQHLVSPAPRRHSAPQAPLTAPIADRNSADDPLCIAYRPGQEG
ncbi:hypothetical protein ACCO45_013292 [Purpureocillium lilacinum]|uniref:Uncharacterized protein n=1 Tax=Purpureocillium lilacinum TaxID=33203 RepID=A0ACC4DBZ4_PURLI